METKQIIIDLSQSHDAGPRKEENLIQRLAWEEIHDKINAFTEEAKKKVEESDSNLAYQRNHSAIAVFGRRGEGKSTFVISVLRDYEASKDNSEVFPLDIIDPTLMENGEHPLLYIISEIKEKVESFRSKRCLGSNNSEGKYEDWRDTLSKLARGLKALEGIGSDYLKKDSWEDEIFVLEEGLKNSSSGQRLERDLNKFIEASLAYLGKEIFLIAFDDVDTHFGKGWTILEVIRKYLTSPKILVILSGDLDLYRSLIRKRQWEMLGDLPGKDGEVFPYSPMVQELEEQYLLKILKNENRIRLRPISEYLKTVRVSEIKERPQLGYELHVKFNKEEHDLSSFLHMQIKKYFHITDKDVSFYKDLICSLPIRTVIQLLVSMFRWNKHEDAFRFHEDLAQIFLSTLSAYNIRSEDVNFIDGSLNLDFLARILSHQNLWESGYRLKPTSSKTELDKLFMVLGGAYTHKILNNPAAFFEYFIKIGLTKELIQLNPEVRKNDKSSRQIAIDYLSFLGISAHEPAMLVARRAMGVLRDVAIVGREKPSVYLGTIRLNNDSYIKTKRMNLPINLELLKESIPGFYEKIPGKSDRIFGRLINTVDSLTSCIESSKSSFVSAITTINVGKNGEKRTVLSFYSLIGLIVNYLKSKDKEALVSRFRLDAHVRSYSFYSNQQLIPEQESQEEDEYKETVIDNAEDIPADDLLLDLIYKWSKSSSKISGIPFFVLGRIWDRFNATLIRIREEHNPKTWLAGKLISRYCVAFLNSILTEVLIFEGKIPNLKSPTTDDQIFEANLLKRESKTDEMRTFFDWVWACPVWGLFLESLSLRKNYIDHLNKYLKDFYSESIVTEEHYNVKYTFSDIEPKATITYSNLIDPMNSLAIVGSTAIITSTTVTNSSTPPKIGIRSIAEIVYQKKPWKGYINTTRKEHISNFLNHYYDEILGIEAEDQKSVAPLILWLVAIARKNGATPPKIWSRNKNIILDTWEELKETPQKEEPTS